MLFAAAKMREMETAKEEISKQIQQANEKNEQLSKENELMEDQLEQVCLFVCFVCALFIDSVTYLFIYLFPLISSWFFLSQ
jgi:hypothetical protein